MNINSRIKQLLQTSLVAIVAMASGLSAMAQTFDASNITFGGINMPYRVAHTSGMEKPSLVIYLHGGTSKGNDNEKQMGEPGIDIIANYINQRQIGAYFLVPQCPSDKSWGGPMLSVLKALIDKYVMEGVVDKNSVYIFGGSMGGTGIWSMLSAYPGMFAAAMPVAGNPTGLAAECISKTPLYTVMGTADRIMKIEPVQDILSEMDAFGASYQLDIEQDWTHEDVCKNSYTIERLDWVFSHVENTANGIDMNQRDLSHPILIKWYDLQGHLLPNMPNHKGVYLKRSVYFGGKSECVKVVL